METYDEDDLLVLKKAALPVVSREIIGDMVSRVAAQVSGIAVASGGNNPKRPKSIAFERAQGIKAARILTMETVFKRKHS